MPKNRRPDLNGMLLVDKPLRWTSFDIVRLVRSATGGAKVGHAGTLDPLATGLLVLCLGSATKRIESVMGAEKVYDATIQLGATTPTDDLESEVIAGRDLTEPDDERVRSLITERFVGTIDQAPPAHSAMKVDGQRAYRLARAGELDTLPTRRITIHAIDIVAYAFPELRLRVRCGKGTYIRSLARDIGETLGIGGYLSALRRTRIGTLSVDAAVTPDHIKAGQLPLAEV